MPYDIPPVQTKLGILRFIFHGLKSSVLKTTQFCDLMTFCLVLNFDWPNYLEMMVIFFKKKTTLSWWLMGFWFVDFWWFLLQQNIWVFKFKFQLNFNICYNYWALKKEREKLISISLNSSFKKIRTENIFNMNANIFYEKL